MREESSLSVKLLPLTSQTIWERGEEYADTELVDDVRQEGAKVIAHVYGTKRYLVKITLKGQVTGQCSCPYALSGEVCKHIVATAIAFDEQRGLKRPTQETVEKLARKELPKFVGRATMIDQIFSDPLNANLDTLRTYNDFGKWVRPHAKLPPRPAMVTDANKPLTVKEVGRVFDRIFAWQNRYKYDPYFCAGEVTAGVCEVFRIIYSRLPKTTFSERVAVFVSCLCFYYRDYLSMIDGSDGVWQIAEAHLAHFHKLLRKQGMNEESLLPFKKRIENAGEGWGLTFIDIVSGNFLSG